MPFFSKRKSGKARTKLSKDGSAQQGNVTETNASEKQSVGSKQSFNGISTTPDLTRKDLLEAGQRPPNSTAKCVANFPRRSRLSKSLPEVLVDDSVLPLFLEFLQKQGAQNVLNFWLAVESFRLSSGDKKLFSYKSRLKPKENQGVFDNTMFDVQNNLEGGTLQLDGIKNSSETNLNKERTLQKYSNSFTNDDERLRNLNSELGGYQDINKQINLASSLCTSSQNDDTNYPEMLTLPNLAGGMTRNIDNSSQRNGCSVSTVYDSVELNTELSSLNISAMSNSMLPIYTQEATESQCKYSEISNNSGTNSSSKPTQKNVSPCNDVLQIQQQAEVTGGHSSQNKNEQCSLSADEISLTKDKKLTRAESNDTKRERRRMAKVMMDDALNIYRHFISLDATQPLGIDENIRREVESNICSENGVIDPDCFSVAQKFAFNVLQSRYFDDFIRGSYYQKHIMDILTSGKVFLADIMYNDNAMFYFMEFMEQEEKSYLLAFWIAVDSFWQELQSKLDKQEYNAEEALEDAMVLYNKYFSMQASNSLGVSDETRIRIENKICREGGPLPNCFEEPMENVLTLLEEVYFPIFLDSSVYMKYLNELFSSVIDADSDQTSTCADDCSSTASATDTGKLMESLVTDVEAHDDPDEIWQRPHFGLSIGRVNEFGIYEPGIEPQPGKEVLKFGQKMKKLVSGDSDKVKEEMAWKVAKMVLEDVKKQQKTSK